MTRCKPEHWVNQNCASPKQAEPQMVMVKGKKRLKKMLLKHCGVEAWTCLNEGISKRQRKIIDSEAGREFICPVQGTEL